MTTPPSPHDQARRDLSGDRATRLDELLCERAVFGLDPADEAELAVLLGHAVDLPGDDDLAAAQVALAATADSDEPLPAGLRDRVLGEARGFDFATASAEARRPMPRLATAALPTVTEAPSRARNLMWTLATAASLLIGLGLGGQWFRDGGFGEGATSNGAAPPAMTLAAELASLREAPDATTIAWSSTEDPAAVGPAEASEERDAFDWGEVVWSDDAGRGFMVFHGLAANDPSVEQYQLWVFDEERSADYPVDGGVFDLPGKPGEAVAEVIVPIDARLPITRATLFAVTVEKPGGVVVSDRSRLPLLAQR